jgi:group I intron endonuclease
MNDFYVYEWIRLDTNEPFYVGKGQGGRAYYPCRNRYFNNIIKKLGFENVAVVILHEGLTEEEALEYEVYYIAVYKDEFGFKLSNMTDGGEGITGYHHTEETREKLAKVMREIRVGENAPMFGKTHSKQSRLKMSKARIGVQPANKGVPMPPAAKEKMRRKLTGRKLSDEARAKTKLAFLGKNHSEEAKERISKVNSGKGNGMFGKPSPRRKVVQLLDPVTKEVIDEFPSVKHAVEATGIGHQGIKFSATNDKPFKGKLFSYRA